MKAAFHQTEPALQALDAAADQAISACGGDARQAVKALIVANDFLEPQLEGLRKQVSTYARGRLPGTREQRGDPDD
ncbi:stage V sporulation protein SpoVS [Bradyrhizobium diazoefficiens]